MAGRLRSILSTIAVGPVMKKRTTIPTVLALIAANEVSGPCRELYQVISHAKDLNVRFIIGMFLLPGFQTTPAIDEARRRGFHVEIIRQQGRSDISTIFRIKRMVQAWGVNILESHSYKPALVSWILRKMIPCHWVAFAHGYTDENLNIDVYTHLDKWLMKRANAVVAVSQATGHMLQQTGVCPDRIRVIHNAIDPLDYPCGSGVSFRNQYLQLSQRFLIGVIGRLSREKGHDIFLDAFAAIVRRIPESHAVFIGDGPQRSQLQKKVRRQGLSQHVSFAGHCTDIAPVYAAVDLVVIPSLSEGLPNVLLEALLYGKAVVATCVGGIPEVMQGALSQYLVPSGNAPALTEIIIKVCRNDDWRSQGEALGKEHVIRAFSPQHRTKDMVKMYHEVLDHTYGCSTNISRHDRSTL